MSHTCNTYQGCSGGCIAIKNTNSVIGIHKGSYITDKEKFNVGIFIKDIFEDIKIKIKKQLEGVNHYSYNLL